MQILAVITTVRLVSLYVSRIVPILAKDCNSCIPYPYSGAPGIEIEAETKRILLRSRQATHRPSPESSPVVSPAGSVEDLTAIPDDTVLDQKAKEAGVMDREVHLQEIEPDRFLNFGTQVWRWGVLFDFISNFFTLIYYPTFVASCALALFSCYLKSLSLLLI